MVLLVCIPIMLRFMGRGTAVARAGLTPAIRAQLSASDFAYPRFRFGAVSQRRRASALRSRGYVASIFFLFAGTTVHVLTASPFFFRKAKFLHVLLDVKILIR